jgi:hypothetical protein
MTHGHSESKPNTTVIAIASIVAILLIVVMTVSFNNRVANANNANLDYTGKVSEVAPQVVQETKDNSLCKLIVGRTTIYDDSTLAVTLGVEETTFYSGYSIKVVSVNSEGCVVDINGNNDYLASGQVQRLGNLYVTVKDTILN